MTVPRVSEEAQLTVPRFMPSSDIWLHPSVGLISI